MNLSFSYLDSVTVLILLSVFIQSKERNKYWDTNQQTEHIVEAEHTLEKLKELSEPEDPKLAAMAAQILELKILRAAAVYQFWIGPRSFAVMTAFALVTLFIQITSLPGVLLGFMLSSPKLQFKVIHALKSK